MTHENEISADIDITSVCGEFAEVTTTVEGVNFKNQDVMLYCHSNKEL